MSEFNADTLCVVHQSTDFGVVKLLPAFQLANRILLLTSHKLFPHEIIAITSQLDEIGKTLSGTICFGDFLDDKSLVACDDQASDELAPLFGSTDYITQYQNRMSELKNQALFKAVCSKWKFDRIIASDGLGISSSVWLKGTQGTNVDSAVPPWKNFGVARRLAKSIWARLNRPFKRYELLKVKCEPPVFFYSSVSRLRIRPDISLEPLIGTISELQRQLDATRGSVLATTIHDYQPDGLQQQLNAPFEIYVDGLHPANIPRSYLDGYPDASYVVRDMFDDQWFRQFGKRTRSGRAFLASSEMALPGGDGLISTVYLMLNHAGDWMALVNRSDTDLLLLAFVELAQAFPNVRFVVRPHPGCAHPEHEGVGAISRIKQLVAAAEAGNLEVSGGTLDHDIDAADLIISEYSNVLVEGWRMGVPGLVVNLTRRRNFMQDYTELGFPTVTNQEQLHAWFANMLTHPENLIQTQTKAATSYNQRLALYMESA